MRVQSNYIGLLCTELANEDKPQDARQQAGLLLKNTLTSRNEQEQKNLENRWIAVQGQAKTEIKKMVRLFSRPSHA